MANIRKQFNFRNGVQVDDDNLVVSPTGLVGIGTTIPTESLDVRGNAKVVGLASLSQVFTPNLTATTANITNLTLSSSIIGSGVSISSGIITASGSGIVTYYGDGVNLLNIPTSQWVDVNSGLGFTTIYAQGFVGVGTDDPRFVFQVSGTNDTSLVGFSSGVGITSEGNILATGIATAAKFVGIGSDLTQLTAENVVYGTLSLDRLPSLPDYKLDANLNLGIVTTTSLNSTDVNVGGALTVTGALTGTATTALGLTGVPDIIVGVLTATAVAASSFIGGITGDVTGTATTATSLTSDAAVDIQDLTVGVATVSTTLIVDGKVGIGSSSPLNDFVLQKVGSNANLQIISTEQSAISLGTSESVTGKNGVIRYANNNLLFPYSDPEALDLINYGNGNFNYYLQAGDVGINTGSFYWHHKSTDTIMTLTYEGNLGLGITNPSAKLEVSGITSTTDLFATNNIDLGGRLIVGGDIVATGSGSTVTVESLYIKNGSAGLLDGTGNELIDITFGNANISSGISTFFDMDIDGRLHVESDTLSNGGLLIAPGSYSDYPVAALQVGTGLSDEDVFVVTDSGQVGIGTTSIPESVTLDCRSGTAVFSRVGVGTTVLAGVSGSLYVLGAVQVEPGPDEPGNPVLSVTGIVTATDGFSSDGTGPVKISVSGNQLTFTVNGVGSTTLTLS